MIEPTVPTPVIFNKIKHKALLDSNKYLTMVKSTLYSFFTFKVFVEKMNNINKTCLSRFEEYRTSRPLLEEKLF